MNVDDIIYQLRTYCPSLVSVAGAAELETAQEIANLPMPAAYVVPLSQDAGANENMNGLWQVVSESFAVLVAFDNRIDGGRGQATATTSYGSMTKAVHKALLNWRMDPETSIKGLQFEGSNLVKQDRARAWYRWVYSNDYVLDETDGFDPDSVDLEEIDLSVSNGGDTLESKVTL